MTLRYSSVRSFWKFLGINNNVLDFQPGNTPSRETVANSPVTAGDYYLDQLGVNSDTLELFAGTANSPLPIGTAYSFNSERSKLTITAAGETSLSGQNLTAEYDYNDNGKDLSYDESTAILERAEDTVNNTMNTVFANQSSSTVSYINVFNENQRGQGFSNDLYNTNYAPTIQLQTTTNGAYTTGGSTITLTDATGFPNSAAIYIGGNKVVYSARSGNDITVPSTTPSIDDGADVRGEVVEVSLDGGGVTATFEVLVPDVDFSFDHNTGEIQLTDDYYNVGSRRYWNYTRPVDGLKNRFRVSYQSAWHDLNQDAVIPEDATKVTLMIASRQLLQRTIFKSHTGQRDNFDPQQINFSREDIDRILNRYQTVNVKKV